MAGDWGTINTGTGATYWSNLGGGHGGHGGPGGHGSLNGQMNAFMDALPDPNQTMNAFMGYMEQLRQRKRVEDEKERIRQTQETARATQAALPQNQPRMPYDRLAAEEASKASIAQSRSQYQLPPQKWIQPVNAMSGAYLPDESVMSGAQRQAFLPGQATFSGPAGPSPAGLSPSPDSLPYGKVNSSPEDAQMAAMETLRVNNPAAWMNMLALMARRG